MCPVYTCVEGDGQQGAGLVFVNWLLIKVDGDGALEDSHIHIGIGEMQG